MSTLHDLSIKELDREPFDSNDLFVIQDIIENPYSYLGVRSFSGWYPQIFYYNARDLHSGVISPCDTWDALVTDVFSDPEDDLIGDPGCELHEGVGTIPLLMISVNWESNDATVYAGPVMSQYEFQLDVGTRETDAQWQSALQSGVDPAPPDWTTSYFVPGEFPFPPWVGIQPP